MIQDLTRGRRAVHMPHYGLTDKRTSRVRSWPEGDDLLLPLVEAKVLLLHVIMCDVSLTTQSDLSSTVASGKSAVDEV